MSALFHFPITINMNPCIGETSGGIGKFGFNSYDLMTFLLLTFNAIGNVIVNTNKNENNNNNNDFQAMLGTINSNSDDVITDQTNMNGAMIVVPPAGPPVVVPTAGRSVRGLNNETIFRNGTIINGNVTTHGLVHSGSICENGTFTNCFQDFQGSPRNEYRF